MTRKNPYSMSRDTRRTWLPTLGKVIAKVRIRSVKGVSTETGIGGGNDFSTKKNRDIAINRAIDDAIAKHLERFADERPEDVNKPVKQTYGASFVYEKDRYGDGKGGWEREAMGIRAWKVLDIRVRYAGKNLTYTTERRGKNRYVVTRDNGRFVKGGFTRIDKDSRVTADKDGRLDSGNFSDDDPFESYR